jgi:hypothetical protein
VAWRKAYFRGSTFGKSQDLDPKRSETAVSDGEMLTSCNLRPASSRSDREKSRGAIRRRKIFENDRMRPKEASIRAPGWRRIDFDQTARSLLIFPGELAARFKERTTTQGERPKVQSYGHRSRKRQEILWRPIWPQQNSPANSPLASRAKSPVISSTLAEQLHQQGFGDWRPTMKI